jgi:hypothetical protein
MNKLRPVYNPQSYGHLILSYWPRVALKCLSVIGTCLRDLSRGFSLGDKDSRTLIRSMQL